MTLTSYNGWTTSKDEAKIGIIYDPINDVFKTIEELTND
jgi:hypothetical protein